MMEIAESCPDVDVQAAEYLRLLGYPRGFVLQDRARELADWAREWYARHGRAWVYARAAATRQAGKDTVHVGGTTLTSSRLVRLLCDAGADRAVLVAVSAGPELEQEAQVRWKDGKPDEYFFLEAYGSAVVERLITTVGARLCAWAEERQLAVLPHYSPGYPEWDVSEQPRLLALIKRNGAARPGSPLAVEVLDSGMLRPKKSLLAVFGVTPHIDRVQRLADLVPCAGCSFQPCQFRRAPYRRELDVGPEPAHGYSVNVKALRRWAAERLSLDRRPDGSVQATFRYEGTTCINTGRPFECHYAVTLGPREDGHPIRAQHCAPAPGDVGHTHMCEYQSNPLRLLAGIAADVPLAGRPLADVLTWTRPPASAGCYCDADSRQHKWGLVLETIHYALGQTSSPAGTEEATA